MMYLTSNDTLTTTSDTTEMCDPTALLDLVPDEALLKRPCMDYNEYTYCYGAGRGQFYKSNLKYYNSYNLV